MEPAFPLVIPEGVELMAYPQMGNVYIWSDNSTTQPASILELTSYDTGNPKTRLKSLTVIGGKVGVHARVDRSSAAGAPAFEIELTNVTLGGSEIDLGILATDARIVNFVANNCRVKRVDFSTIPLVNPPEIHASNIGIQFLATSDSTEGVGTINAELNGFKTVGSEFSTSPVNFTNYCDYKELPVGQRAGASRLIDAQADGHSSFTLYGGGVVPQVNLQLNGCELNGRKDVDVQKGWEFGVFAASAYNGPIYHEGDFHSAVHVELSGCKLSQFELDGIYAGSSTNSKVELEMNACEVFENGQADSGPVGGNGVHLFSMEGYTSLLDSGSQFWGNTERGLLAHCMGTRAGGLEIPNGVWVGLEGTEMDNNLSHGLQLAGPFTYVNNGQMGVVGGTVDAPNDSDYSLIEAPGKGYLENYGIGFVDKALIHDNGGDGVNVLLTKAFHGGLSFASCIFTNSFIWNNGQHGFHLESKDTDPDQMHFLVPIVHCTIVKNSGYSFKVTDVPLVNSGFFFYTDPVATAIGAAHPKMRIHNSIFERQNPTHPDVDLPTYDLFSAFGGSVPSSRIGIGGTRGRDYSGSSALPGLAATTDSTPFAGYSDPSLPYPAWLYLEVGPNSTNFVDSTSAGLGYDLYDGRYLLDYEGGPRIGFTTGLHDKGAEEAVH